MAGLELKNIYKVYPNGTKAVNNFTMEIRDKEFIVFVGPSGCGKSTVLRMIAGLEEITAGELKIDGEVVNDVDCKLRDTAMVFQNYALYPHMTVAENMAFPLKMVRTPKEEIVRKVSETAEILGLTEYLDKRPGAMSGGQRQRVALGRAMVRNPKVFLLDEPLSNLDAKLRTQMRSEITKLHKRLQTTFIYVTHDQTEAMTMGDRIVVMKKGVIQQIDTPMNLYAYPENRFVAGFIGTPSMNFFDATVERDGERAVISFANGRKQSCDYADIRKIDQDYLGKEIVMGVRPEDFVIAEDGEECLVVNREVLGSETLLYCDFDTANTKGYENSEYGFIVKAGGDVAVTDGQIIRVQINCKKVHFFDKETEVCIKKRLVQKNDLTVCVRAGTLALGTERIPLPFALSDLNGEYDATIPTDSVVLEGGNIPATVAECEQIGEKYLMRIFIGGEELYALDDQPWQGNVLVRLRWQNIRFRQGGAIIKDALAVRNEWSCMLFKRKLNKKERKALPSEEYRTFDIEVAVGEKRLLCPLQTAKRILGASDRKLFGTEMRIVFGEGDVKSGSDFFAQVLETYDYGAERFARCSVQGAECVLPVQGEASAIDFSIDLATAAIYDPTAEIRIS